MSSVVISYVNYRITNEEYEETVKEDATKKYSENVGEEIPEEVNFVGKLFKCQ